MIGAFSYTEKEQGLDVDNFLNSSVEKILGLNNTAAFALDYRTFQFAYLSENCAQVLGHDEKTLMKGGPQYFFERVVYHEDSAMVLSLFYYSLKSLLAIANHNLSSYKLTCLFRIMSQNGQVANVLQSGGFINCNERLQPIFELGIWQNASHWAKSNKTFCIFNQKGNGPAEMFTYHNAQNAMVKLQLTGAERGVLKRISRGLKTTEIAQELGIKDNTVNTHRRNMLYKMGLSSMEELVNLTMHSGWLDITSE